jgi:beta-N-acetylhexosaminidase
VHPSELIFAGLPGPELDRHSARVLELVRPGGIVLLTWNFVDLEQLVELTAALRRLLPDVVLAIDAEGGRVDRLRHIVAPAPAAEDLAHHSPGLSYQAGLWVARALTLFGFDVDFAPVVDLDRGLTNNALDRRCFGAAPEAVIPRARAFLHGLHEGGVGGCLKHFPGLGGAGEDTHEHGSAVYLPDDALRADLAPFAELSELAGAVMIGHAAYPAWDVTGRPATLSPAILGGLLRGRLGFAGVSFSDDLSMKALDPAGGTADRAEAAFAAGCDVVLACRTLDELPEVVERLAQPALEERRAEAYGRWAVYRERLETLRLARESERFLAGNASHDRLAEVRHALTEIGESVRRGQMA